MNDFVKAVPIDRPLCESTDKDKIPERAQVFISLFNAFGNILLGYGNLSNWKDKKNIIARIPALRQEASFWTSFTDQDRHFGTEMDNMVKKYILEADFNRYTAEKTNETA